MAILFYRLSNGVRLEESQCSNKVTGTTNKSLSLTTLLPKQRLKMD